MATNGTLHAEERRGHLLAALERDGAVQLEQIATELGVSSMTVRRDLDDLESEGLLRRVRGGAVSILGPRPFSERRAVRSRAKQAIAEKALALIPSSGAIALDASTTAGESAAAGRLAMGRSGRMKRKTEPWPGELSTSSRPFIISTRRCTLPSSALKMREM